MLNCHARSEPCARLLGPWSAPALRPQCLRAHAIAHRCAMHSASHTFQCSTPGKHLHAACDTRPLPMPALHGTGSPAVQPGLQNIHCVHAPSGIRPICSAAGVVCMPQASADALKTFVTSKGMGTAHCLPSAAPGAHTPVAWQGWQGHCFETSKRLGEQVTLVQCPIGSGCTSQLAVRVGLVHGVQAAPLTHPLR